MTRRLLPPCFAALCTVLVLLLGVVAVDDRLHAQLHPPAVADCGHDHEDTAPDQLPHDEAACAVDLFAAGLTVPLDPAQVVVAPHAARDTSFAPDVLSAFASPAHLLPPGRGPPRA